MLFVGKMNKEGDDLLRKCFEFDWKCSKIHSKLIKDETEKAKIKHYLSENYYVLRECYRYFSGISPSNGIPSIGTNALNELISQSTIADGKLMNVSEIGIDFAATNVVDN